MTQAVTVDVAGGPMGGAARFRDELLRYLSRTERSDVSVVGSGQRLSPRWLLRRELVRPGQARRIALNNVGFLAPGGPRWTLLGNALHFLTSTEISNLDPSLLPIARRQAAVVRLAAQRSDVLIAPCSAMADRVSAVLPSVQDRIAVRMHPVSAEPIMPGTGDATILCPVLFESYKDMSARLIDWIDAVDGHLDPAVKLLVTARPDEVPRSLAHCYRLEFVGRLTHSQLRRLWIRSCAVYFPPGLESFGYPLAEARANGQPVIARDTHQNREIAGRALCGFMPGDPASLRDATMMALKLRVTPDPGPFNPDAYFEWMLGPRQ
jgi:glycosyltransferase involved in cell wall biosynthesis